MQPVWRPTVWALYPWWQAAELPRRPCRLPCSCSYTSAVLEATLAPTKQPPQLWRDTMAEMARASCEAYRKVSILLPGSAGAWMGLNGSATHLLVGCVAGSAPLLCTLTSPQRSGAGTP